MSEGTNNEPLTVYGPASSLLEFVARSPIYADVLGTLIDGPKRPSMVASLLDDDTTSASHALRQLAEKELVELIDPPHYTSDNAKWYDLTAEGCFLYIHLGRIYEQPIGQERGDLSDDDQ